MNKISNGQLFAVLLCVRAFELICSQAAADASQMAGAAVSIIIQFLLAIPMIMLYRQKNFRLKDEILFGKTGMLLYALFFIAEGAVTFNKLWSVSTSVYFPVNSSLACAIILAAVSLYCASLKMNALSRSAVITAGILIFTLAVMIFGAYPKADILNYIPQASLKSFANSLIKNFCSSSELALLFILLEFSAGKNNAGNAKGNIKGVTAFFIGSLILTELIYIIEITVLGRIINLTDFPFFTAGAFSQPFSIQRADSLYMITFTILCVLTVTLQLSLTSVLVNEILPDLKYNTLLSVILMLGLSALLNYTNADISLLMGILVIILSVIIPIIMLIRRTNDDKKNGNSTGNNTASAVRMQS